MGGKSIRYDGDLLIGWLDATVGNGDQGRTMLGVCNNHYMQSLAGGQTALLCRQPDNHEFASDAWGSYVHILPAV